MQQLNLKRNEVLFRRQIETRRGYCFVKRIIDIVCSLIGLIALSPVFIIVAIVIKIESKGSIFFSQERIGEKG